MARKVSGLGLTPQEITNAFQDPVWAERFPPFLNAKQAADLLQIPLHTLYAWSSAGQLKGCGRRLGKGLRFSRDRLISKLFNEGLNNHG